MQVAFEIADRTLARCIVAEGDMNVGIDQARNRRHAAGIDDDIRGLDRGRRGGTHAHDLAIVRDDGVTRGERVTPVAGNDFTQIDDRDFHSGPFVDASLLQFVRERIGRQQILYHTGR